MRAGDPFEDARTRRRRTKKFDRDSRPGGYVPGEFQLAGVSDAEARKLTFTSVARLFDFDLASGSPGA